MVTIAVSLTKTFIAFVIANEAKPRSSTRSSARWKNCSETCSCDKVRPKEERRCFRRKKLQRRVTGKIPPLRCLHDDKAFPEEFFFSSSSSSSSSSINEKQNGNRVKPTSWCCLLSGQCNGEWNILSATVWGFLEMPGFSFLFLSHGRFDTIRQHCGLVKRSKNVPECFYQFDRSWITRAI